MPEINSVNGLGRPIRETPELVNRPIWCHSYRMYLIGRCIEGKQHDNVPRDILGEKQPCSNHLYSPQAERVVIVEGQADTITFAEWGIPAVAVGGMVASDGLDKDLTPAGSPEPLSKTHKTSI